MLTWHKIHEGSYEGRVDNIILARVWYDTPLFFGKDKATWRSRSAFPGVGYRGFGSSHATLEEAQAAMDDFVARVAKAVLTV